VKKYLVAIALSLTTLSAAYAAAPASPAGNMMQSPSMDEMHAGMMGKNDTQSAPTFAQLNQHEQAAVALSFTPNGQSGPLQEEAERHLRMINN